MTYKVQIAREAQHEYRLIITYLVDIFKSPTAAGHFMDEFDRQIDLICESPEMYPLSQVPELAARGYRAFRVNGYIALYRIISKNVLVIAHIFHQTQDYARLV